MSKVEFNYEGKTTTIQCNSNDKMKDIYKKFITKNEIDVKSVYFLYGGNTIEEELTFEQIINNVDKENNKMIILVNPVNCPNKVKNKNKKSKNIICPECGESCKIKIDNYKISLYDCKNKHNKKNILIDKFENTQYIDESKIICEECKVNNKEITYNNQFFRCNVCKKIYVHYVIVGMKKHIIRINMKIKTIYVIFIIKHLIHIANIAN